MTEPILKDCPFCGSKAQFRQALWPSDGDCDAIIHSIPSECGLTQFSNETADRSVIELWNVRAETAENKVVALIDVMRLAGWTVAVHNDFRLSGQKMTFWLWTHAETRRFVKGEGSADLLAMQICAAEAGVVS